MMSRKAMSIEYAEAVAGLIGDAIEILVAMRDGDGKLGRPTSIVITELEKALAYLEMFVAVPLKAKQDDA